MDNLGRFKKAEREQLIEQFLAGKIGKYNIPFEIVQQIYEQFLAKGSKAFGEVFTDPMNPFYSKTKNLNKNIAQFAANKVVHNLNDLSNARALYGEKEFVNVAEKINERYLFQWLETEYKTGIKMANSARKWVEIDSEKELFPLLQYVAILDDNTRDEHAALDGIIRPVNDGFWDSYYPTNGYNCRCTVDQLRRGEVSDLRQYDVKSVDENMNSVFKVNPGKQEKLFNNTHPYLDRRKRTLNKKQIAEADKLTKKLIV